METNAEDIGRISPEVLPEDPFHRKVHPTRRYILNEGKEETTSETVDYTGNNDFDMDKVKEDTENKAMKANVEANPVEKLGEDIAEILLKVPPKDTSLLRSILLEDPSQR